MAPTTQVTIVQGSTANLVVQLIDGNTGNPFSLAGLTGATGVFPKSDGTGMAVSGVLQSQDLGTLLFSIDETHTPNLNPGEQQTIQVMVDQGATRSIAEITSILTVVAPAFSTISF